ncbi:MAG: tetratricopeptide repeat protein [Prolixibacteraceae bacterium]
MKKVFTSILILTSLISLGQNPPIDYLWKLYNSQDLKSVIEKAKPLLENDPNNIDLNLMIGRSFTDRADFKNAIPYLELAARTDSSNSWRKAWALRYLGVCYYMLEDYDGSKKSLKECFDLKVTKNVTQDAGLKILLFGFDDFYKDWKTVESDNFRFHFQNMSESDIKSYISSREDAFQNINTFFNSQLPKKIDFFVWESKEDAMNLLRANLGFAEPASCIVHSHYQQTRGHEMTHVVSNYSTGMVAKTGLINEGTAVCFDQTNQNREQIVKDWLKANGKKIQVGEIWANWKSYPEDLTYPLSGLFVRELIDNFGREKFLQFFGNQTYENARLIFDDHLDVVIKEFENKIN